MNLSSDTLSLLKNFSEINQGILVKPGNTIKTISNMKNILAEAQISETFSSEFAIYDLPEFLRSIELFEKPQLQFNGGSSVKIDNGKGRNINYYFSDKSVVVAPEKNINLPDKYITFKLTKQDLSDLLKSATSLGSPDVTVQGDGKNIKLMACDRKNKSSNVYSATIGETDKKFSANFKQENFKLIQDDYDVAISKAKISHFTNRNKPIQYWIALEPDSEF